MKTRLSWHRLMEDSADPFNKWRSLTGNAGDVHSEILSIAWQKTASENNLLLDSILDDFGVF